MSIHDAEYITEAKEEKWKKIKGINTHENNERHIYYEVMKSFPHFALCAISNIKMHSALCAINNKMYSILYSALRSK